MAQQHLRAILGNIGGLVMPGQTFVTFREGLVDEDHGITDEKTRAFLQAFIAQFASLVAKLTR